MTSQAVTLRCESDSFCFSPAFWYATPLVYRKGQRLRIPIGFLNVTCKNLCSIKTDAGLDLVSAVGRREGGIGSRMWRPESDRSVAKDKSGNL